MIIYKAITSATTTTLITKNHKVNGDINKITICNNSASAATGINVHVVSGVGGEPAHPLIANVTIPSGATLVLDDNLSFDGSKFNLKIVDKPIILKKKKKKKNG